jgi:hypothetical protein
MLRLCQFLAVVAALMTTGCQFTSRSNPTPEEGSDPSPQVPPSLTSKPTSEKVDPNKPTPQPVQPLPGEPSKEKPGKPKPVPSAEDAKKLRTSQVTARFVRLGANPGADRKPIYVMEIELKNMTGKDIKGYQGGLFFYDQDGNIVYNLGWLKGPLKVDESRKEGFVAVTIDDKTVKLMQGSPDKIKAEFEASEITFEDGTVKKF